MKFKPLAFAGLAALAALVSLPAPARAASILLSAGDFTLLGGTSITSTGVAGTVISNGNVGLSPGATTGITGFPPAVIENGAIIATGPITGQARLDLIKAQVGLAGMRSNKNLSTVDLAGKTLPPGVYSFNEGANLTGALVLDGQGRNNAFWVFQIGTALTTSVNSSVTIINRGSNGGRDYGIFWNAGSAINIGANNQIAGNYLAGTSITFGSTSGRGGRALALAAISLDNNQLDARGGPGGSDWGGGLKYDDSGAVVAREDLAFRIFGANRRIFHRGGLAIRGDATVTAVSVQWRANGLKSRAPSGRWHTRAIRQGGLWTALVKARDLRVGKNELRFRAVDDLHHVTAIKKRVVLRR